MKPYHILLVEDDQPIMDENARRLEAEGYRVSAAATLAEGRSAVRAQAPDLAVVDILLPDGSGLDLCRELRAAAVPVLFLTSLADRQQVVDGLRAGGDDYLTKPYHLDELVARIEALLRRMELLRTWDESPELGGVRLDLLRQRAYRQGEDLLLKPKEFQLLALLMKHRNRYTPLEELYAGVWGQTAVDPRPVIAHLSTLRLKLAAAGCALEIQHVRVRGYRLGVRDEGRNLKI